MGPRLLCFAGGGVLTASFVHQGLLATPFFGSGALLWANVFGAFLLALALGYGLGDLFAAVVGRTHRERAGPRLAVLGGLAAWASAYWAPVACRWVLGFDPDWVLAPTAAMVLVTLVPGSLIAAVVPSEVRLRLAQDERDDAAAARAALRLLGLMTLGGVVGVAVSGRALLRADEVDVWLNAYGAGALLVGLGLVVADTPTRVVGAAGLVGLAALAAVRPSEVQRLEFAVALEDAWREHGGASLYYRRTAVDRDLLDAGELEKLAERAGATYKPGVILTCELLAGLGAITVEGEGLRNTLRVLVRADSLPYLMPIFEQVESIRSNGKGLLFVKIRRTRGVEGARFSLPGGQPGDRVDFWFKNDFTIRLVHREASWTLEFGPRTTERAGLLELNDTLRTPIRLEDVALWVDASLHAILIDDHVDQVAVRAVAQGEVGGVKTVDVISMSKAAAND